MSKLVLYSDQLIPESEEIDRQLLFLLGKKQPRIGYIPSVSDPSRNYYQSRQAYYDRYNIDLTPYFELDHNYMSDRLNALLTADAIHLSGGNTFYFLHWLKARNMVNILRKYVERGGILIGVSAGSILMTQDIRTTLLCGDTPPLEEIKSYGLRLVDFAFVPHLGSHAALTDVLTYSQQNNNVLVYACPDNAGVVIENNRVHCIGDIVVAKNGSVINP